MVRLTGLRGVLRRWLVTGRGGTSRIGQDRLVSTVRGRRISVTEPGVGRGCATVRRVGRGGLLPVGPAGCGGAVRCDPAVPIRLPGIVRMPVRAGWLRHCWVLRCCGQTPIGRSEIKSGFARSGGFLLDADLPDVAVLHQRNLDGAVVLLALFHLLVVRGGGVVP